MIIKRYLEAEYYDIYKAISAVPLEKLRLLFVESKKIQNDYKVG